LNNISSGAYADLRGVKLWFTDTGGAGVPIVLLHPNTGTVEIWQPQIAAFADHHIRVTKEASKGRTTIRAAVLTGAERSVEIARMLGGASPSPEAAAHADEMLRRARATSSA